MIYLLFQFCRFDLEAKVQEIFASRDIAYSKDIPKWLAWFIVGLASLTVPLAIWYTNPLYLVDGNGYANGGNMYSHLAEILHLKESLKNGSSNFWFDQTALGYPMFMSHQLVPGFATATVILLFER